MHNPPYNSTNTRWQKLEHRTLETPTDRICFRYVFYHMPNPWAASSPAVDPGSLEFFIHFEILNYRVCVSLLQTKAEKMELSTSYNAKLWRDNVLIELNVAVIHSYQVIRFSDEWYLLLSLRFSNLDFLLVYVTMADHDRVLHETFRKPGLYLQTSWPKTPNRIKVEHMTSESCKNIVKLKRQR